MTKLFDARITDLLRNTQLQYNPEVQALAYAILEEKRRLRQLADRTRTMAFIDDLPDAILDILAVELRTPAYTEDLPIETKRELIKGTLAFYNRLGTPWAVNWVIRTIFGNGQISEWFQYNGKAHHFLVSTMNDGTFKTLEGLTAFLRMISTVKRLSSWIDGITVDTELGEESVHLGGVLAITTRMALPEISNITVFGATVSTGGPMTATVRVALPAIQDKLTFEHTAHLGAAAATMTVTIPLPEIP